jgi:hypothetical protein
MRLLYRSHGSNLATVFVASLVMFMARRENPLGF